MSYLNATINNIQSANSLHLVEFTHKNDKLSMMSLELDEALQIGVNVRLLVKPMNIALGKAIQGSLSYSNQLKSTILSIEKGEILCSVTLNYLGVTLESIITTKSLQSMDLKVGDTVVAFIKANDLSISEIIDA